MKQNAFAGLRAELGSLAPVRCIGRVTTVESAVIGVTGLGGAARMGDLVRILRAGGPALGGEVILISGDQVSILPDESTEGMGIVGMRDYA